MKLFDTAIELGKTISMSEQYINLKKTEALVMQDEEAKQLLNDLNILQNEYVKAKKEKLDKGSLHSLQNIIDMKKDEINDYGPTGAFFDAKKQFDLLMKEVNNAILKGITGRVGCDAGCSDCRSCGH